MNLWFFCTLLFVYCFISTECGNYQSSTSIIASAVNQDLYKKLLNKKSDPKSLQDEIRESDKFAVFGAAQLIDGRIIDIDTGKTLKINDFTRRKRILQTNWHPDKHLGDPECSNLSVAINGAYEAVVATDEAAVTVDILLAYGIFKKILKLELPITKDEAEYMDFLQKKAKSGQNDRNFYQDYDEKFWTEKGDEILKPFLQGSHDFQNFIRSIDDYAEKVDLYLSYTEIQDIIEVASESEYGVSILKLLEEEFRRAATLGDSVTKEEFIGDAYSDILRKPIFSRICLFFKAIQGIAYGPIVCRRGAFEGFVLPVILTRYRIVLRTALYNFVQDEQSNYLVFLNTFVAAIASPLSGTSAEKPLLKETDLNLCNPRWGCSPAAPFELSTKIYIENLYENWKMLEGYSFETDTIIPKRVLSQAIHLSAIGLYYEKAENGESLSYLYGYWINDFKARMKLNLRYFETYGLNTHFLENIDGLEYEVILHEFNDAIYAFNRYAWTRWTYQKLIKPIKDYFKIPKIRVSRSHMSGSQNIEESEKTTAYILIQWRLNRVRRIILKGLQELLYLDKDPKFDKKAMVLMMEQMVEVLKSKVEEH